MEIKPIELDENTVLLTIFLKHHQTMNLNEIAEKLKKQSFGKIFPQKALRWLHGML